MTTNHPAHGPVSLDRPPDTREYSAKQQHKETAVISSYAMADAVKVIDGELESRKAGNAQ